MYHLIYKALPPPGPSFHLKPENSRYGCIRVAKRLKSRPGSQPSAILLAMTNSLNEQEPAHSRPRLCLTCPRRQRERKEKEKHPNRTLAGVSTVCPRDYSLDLTASSRYFTFCRGFVLGSQSSNRLRSSSVSELSSVLTTSSSSRPRMIQGSTYGFGCVRPWYLVISQGTRPTLVVSRA